ncbi:MAG: helix-turn-helix domain-containing protein [Eubacteriales bacterium]|nr:helix-turn-helix domain-containing protein [Eubacteriales bacterium]
MQHYTDADFKNILLEYPDEVTKEQFYRLCHVSKRVASFYLEQGFLPCEKRKTQTHKYVIKTADIVAFLKKRQDEPHQFQVPAGTSRKPVDAAAVIRKYIPKETPIDLILWKAFLSEKLIAFPDVCEVRDICRISGYSKETVLKWCLEKKFIFFNINRTYHIPKKTFIDFMASAEFSTIVQKQPIHLNLLSEYEKWTSS